MSDATQATEAEENEENGEEAAGAEGEGEESEESATGEDGEEGSQEEEGEASAEGEEGEEGEASEESEEGGAEAAGGAAEESWEFTDGDQLGDTITDPRSLDTLMVSSREEACALVDEFRAAGGAGAWPSLDRAEVADRLRTLIADPRQFQQGHLNLCGPTSFMVLWCGRDPVGFARYATTLFDEGAARIGALEVRPGTDLTGQDYAAMRALMGTHPDDICPQADWMVTGALRDSADVILHWDGDPRHSLAADSRPEEVASWLRATGIYAEVRDEANWATLAGVPQAEGIRMAPGTDVSLLIHANLIAAATGGRREGGWISRQFPNHFVVLVSEVQQNAETGTIDLTLWTWGETHRYRVPLQDFVDNYYGAIVATLAT